MTKKSLRLSYKSGDKTNVRLVGHSNPNLVQVRFDTDRLSKPAIIGKLKELRQELAMRKAGGNTQYGKCFNHRMNMNASPTFNGGTNRSRVARVRVQAPFRFKHWQVLIPVTYRVGTPFKDVFWSGDRAIMDFSVGAGHVWTAAVTGIPERTLATFDGLTYGHYDAAGWPATKFWISSDVMEFPVAVEKLGFFDYWFGVQLPVGGANRLPFGTCNSSNIIQRHTGVQEFAGEIIQALGAASDICKSAATITAAGTGAGGVQNFWVPTIFKAFDMDNSKEWVSVGDSLTDGVGEGGDTTDNANSDPMGDANGYRGGPERWLARNVGAPHVHIAIGGNRLSYDLDPDNEARRALLEEISPYGVFLHLGFNDFVTAETDFITWAANTPYNLYDILHIGGVNIGYMVTKAGVSGSTPSDVTDIGATVQDGTLELIALGSSASIGLRSAMGVLGRYAKRIKSIRDRRIDTRIIATQFTPNATSTDNFATLVNQTPSALGWTAGGRRDVCNKFLQNSRIRSKLRINAYVNPNTNIENDPVAVDGLWVVNGNARYVTTDGVHYSGAGAELFASGLPNVISV